MTNIMTEPHVTAQTKQAISNMQPTETTRPVARSEPKGGKSSFVAIAEQASGHVKALTPPVRTKTRIHGTD